MEISQLLDLIEGIRISDAGFSVRVVNALARHLVWDKKGHAERKEPIRTIGQLARLSHNELIHIVSLLAGTIKEIEDTLMKKYGIALN